MLIVHVNVHVKTDCIEAFIAATKDNASHSVREQGIARFDVVQQVDDPARFVLVEVYRTPEAPAAHKETAHYQAWRDAVAGMMAEPRSSVKFQRAYGPTRASAPLPFSRAQKLDLTGQVSDSRCTSNVFPADGDW